MHLWASKYIDLIYGYLFLFPFPTQQLLSYVQTDRQAARNLPFRCLDKILMWAMPKSKRGFSIKGWIPFLGSPGY